MATLKWQHLFKTCLQHAENIQVTSGLVCIWKLSNIWCDTIGHASLQAPHLVCIACFSFADGGTLPYLMVPNLPCISRVAWCGSICWGLLRAGEAAWAIHSSLSAWHFFAPLQGSGTRVAMPQATLKIQCRWLQQSSWPCTLVLFGLLVQTQPIFSTLSFQKTFLQYSGCCYSLVAHLQSFSGGTEGLSQLPRFLCCWKHLQSQILQQENRDWEQKTYVEWH